MHAILIRNPWTCLQTYLDVFDFNAYVQKNVKLWHNRNKRFDHPIYLDIESSANSLESGYNNTKLFYLLDKKNPEIKTSCWFPKQ